MATQAIKDEFAKRIDMETAYTLAELKTILSEVYKATVAAEKEAKKQQKAAKTVKREKREKRERDENGEIIKKRPASEYNIFIREQSVLIKQSNPAFDPKTVFKMAVLEWKKHKEQNTPAEPKEPAEAAPEQQAASEEPVEAAPEQPAEAAPEQQAASKEPEKAAKKLAKKPKKVGSANNADE